MRFNVPIVTRMMGIPFITYIADPHFKFSGVCVAFMSHFMFCSEQMTLKIFFVVTMIVALFAAKFFEGRKGRFM